MENNNLKRTAVYILTVLQWVALSVFTGVICGIIGTAFHFSVDFVTELRAEHPFVIYFLPLGGIVIALLYKLCKLEGIGTDKVIDAVKGPDNVPVLLVPLIFISTVITHFLGGSAGREGAALQLGGGIATGVGKIFKLNRKEMHIITLSGMSALFSALFGTPITAAIFSLEVICVGTMYYSAIIPTVIASLVAFYTATLFGVEPVRFALDVNIASEPLSFIKVGGLSVLIALLSILFCLSMHMSHKKAQKLIKNPYIRGFVGGAIVIVLTRIFGTDYNGAGMNIAERAILEGKAEPFAFLLKLLFTAVTIGFGFKGGEIVPTFFVGATFGCVAAPLLGLDPRLGAAIGLVCLFCCVVNCPIASIILSVELFGSEYILFFALACAIGYTLSGYYSLYHSQTVLSSKIRDEIINEPTW